MTKSYHKKEKLSCSPTAEVDCMKVVLHNMQFLLFGAVPILSIRAVPMMRLKL
jgi:hypothetical protein